MNIGVWGIYFCLFVALYFEVFLLISFLEKRPQKKSSRLPNRYPNVSIIVPCFNEEQTIEGTLRSLLALEYPKTKLEIVVVDDGSTDSTLEVANRFIGNPQVSVYHKDNGGKYTALNFGIEHSQGELVGCLDADSFVEPDSLREIVKRLEGDETIMAITPAMKVFRPKRALELMQSVEYTFGIFYKKMFDNLAAINVLPGPFSVYRRDVFTQIGLFRHAHNTEDMEIAFRMHAHGLKIANAHNAVVYTTAPNTLRKLVKQRTRWSQGYLQNSRDYSFMYFNPRFGHFGMLVLPFMLIGFFAGIYTAGYLLWRLSSYTISKLLDLWATRIPLHMPTHVGWFYFNTSVLTFLIVATLLLTLVAIMLGQRIAVTRLTLKSYLSYFAFFGLIAPIWLMRAAWGTLLSKDSSWR